MSRFYLEENVENVISTIILKSPKVQTDLLYLRTIFLDSSNKMKEQIQKLENKYHKYKQKVNAYETQQKINAILGKESCVESGKIIDGMLKSPNNFRKTAQPSQNPCDYSPDLMALILTQAKSIKTIFDSLMKGESPSHPHVETSKLHNLYTAFKEFYKSFKQKHKEYIQDFSYDDKYIHQNSTAMKNRLLEELKVQTQRRKELEEKLQALEEMMEKNMRNKDKLIHNLNTKLDLMIKNDERKGKKIYACENCNNPMTVREEESQEKSLSKEKRKHKNHKPKQQEDGILGPISRQKSGQFYKPTQNNLKNNFILSSQEQFPQKSQRSSEFLSENSSSEDDEKCRSSGQKNKGKKQNIGRFYNGNQTILTGKINETQSDINHSPKAIIQALKNAERDTKLLNQELKPLSKKPEKAKPEKATINQNQNQKSVSKQPKKETEPQLIKRQSFEIHQKALLDQINNLKEDLKKEKEEKIELQKKVKENQTQYKKLQAQVNDLYKLINDSKIHQRKADIQESKQDQQSLFDQITNGNQINKRKDPSPTGSMKNLTEKTSPKKNKKQEMFIDYEDYQEVANKELQMLQSKVSQKGSKIIKFDDDLDESSFFETISPVRGQKPKRNMNDLEIKNFVSPMKALEEGNSQNNSQFLMKIPKMPKTPRKSKETGVNTSNQFMELRSSLKEDDRNEWIKQTAHFGQAQPSERERELMVKVQKLEQMCEVQRRQQQRSISGQKTKGQSKKSDGDELMMMLMLQAYSIEEFLHERQQREDISKKYGDYY